MEVLEVAEGALDGFAAAVEDGTERWVEASGDLGRNVRRGAALGDGRARGIAVVATVRDHKGKVSGIGPLRSLGAGISLQPIREYLMGPEPKP